MNFSITKKIKTLGQLISDGNYREIRQRIFSQLSKNNEKIASKTPRELFLLNAQRELQEFLFSRGTLIFQTSDRPKITILLVLFNKAELTFQCLKSLQNNISLSTPCELLIIDNCSSDETYLLLDTIKGAQIIRNEENVGFLLACNQAIPQISSEYLLLLNNDTVVNPGAVDIALSIFDEEDHVGAVGGRIVLPDNTLQEAGNILWNNGTCIGYGRGFSPTDYRCMFRRQVDYCSGAFLLTKSSLFKQAGGFDPAFMPAYYEETDYCAWLQQNGFKIFFEPRVSLMHFEFGSSEKLAKAFELMNTNRKKFFEKNKNLLTLKAEADNTNILNHRCANPQKRILYVDDRVPHKNLGAGFPRSNHIVNELIINGYFVTIFPTLQAYENWKQIFSDISPNVEVVNPGGIEQFDKFLFERPRYYDVIWISRPHNMKLLESSVRRYLDSSMCKLVYDAEAIFSLRKDLELQARGETEKGLVSLNLRDELELASKADAIVAVSEHEARLFCENSQNKVFTVGHDLVRYPTNRDFSKRTDVVFLGSLHGHPSPNSDSLIWFLESVLPHIKTQLAFFPKIKVVGCCSDAVLKLMEKYRLSIEIVGQVESVFTYLETARVAIIPTRYAAGIPQKAFDIASAALPIVCTELIAMQMNWESGKQCLSCSWQNPEIFAQHCIALYTERELWESIHSELIKFSTEYSSKMSVSTSIKTLLRGL